MNRSLRVLGLVSLALVASCREPNTPAPKAPAVEPPVVTDAPHAAAALANGGSMYAPEVAPATGDMCNLETLGGVPFGADPLLLEAPQPLRGWLGEVQGRLPVQVELRVVDATGQVVASLPVALGDARADVVAAFPGTTGLENSGFTLTLSPSDLPAGVLRLYLAYFAGGSAGVEPAACDNGRRVVVPAR